MNLMANYPKTNGMTITHWNALTLYGHPEENTRQKWSGRRRCWIVTDKQGREFSAKRLENAVDQMVFQNTRWRRYRFHTKSVDDHRPIVFNPKFPWWCSGEAGDNSYHTIIAWLPDNEDLAKYWDDAFSVEFTEHNEIEFTARFAKPDYFVP